MKRYLRYHQPDTLEALQKLVPEIVSDYMDRPHGSLKGLSPRERYQNYEFINFSGTIKQGRAQRFKENKKNICKTCAYKSKCTNDDNSC